MVKVFEWECPKCKKIIKSLYEEQFIVNKEQHILKHERNPTSQYGQMIRNKPLKPKELEDDYKNGEET